MAVQRWNSSDGPVTEAALRAKLESRGYTVARYVYEPGTVFPDHQHGGDWIEIPRGTIHNAAVIGDEPVVSLDAVKL